MHKFFDGIRRSVKTGSTQATSPWKRTLTVLALGCMAGGSLGLTGCGPKFDAAVTGVVLLDGKPLDKGAIIFHPDDASKATVYGHIKSDGSFVMRVGQGDEDRPDDGGIPSGSYTVTVTSREIVTRSADGGPPTPGALLTPKIYATVQSSPLKVNIHPGKNEHRLELDSSLGGPGPNTEPEVMVAPGPQPIPTDESTATTGAEDESAAAESTQDSSDAAEENAADDPDPVTTEGDGQ